MSRPCSPARTHTPSVPASIDPSSPGCDSTVVFWSGFSAKNLPNDSDEKVIEPPLAARYCLNEDANRCVIHAMIRCALLCAEHALLAEGLCFFPWLVFVCVFFI